MVTHLSHGPPDTEALGEAWGREAPTGLVIGLSGDLGAGKTQLVKGLARGLGSPARVHSPTFTLVNLYTGGRLTLFHLDLYRLETGAQIIEAGLEEYLSPDGVTVIEWAEKWIEPAPGAGEQVSGVTCQVSGVSPESLRGSAQPRKPSGFGAGLPRLYRRVAIEVLSETERRLSYEDFGA